MRVARSRCPRSKSEGQAGTGILPTRPAGRPRRRCRVRRRGRAFSSSSSAAHLGAGGDGETGLARERDHLGVGGQRLADHAPHAGGGRAAGELAEQQACQPVALPGLRHRDGELGVQRLGSAHVARLGDHGLAAVREHLGHQRQVIGVVDLREALHQLGRQLAQAGHEAVVAGGGGQVAEERACQVLVLGQHRPHHDAPAAGEKHHVDQLGRVAVDLVGHGSILWRALRRRRARPRRRPAGCRRWAPASRCRQ